LLRGLRGVRGIVVVVRGFGVEFDLFLVYVEITHFWFIRDNLIIYSFFDLFYVVFDRRLLLGIYDVNSVFLGRFSREILSTLNVFWGMVENYI
jgi:hypothetical protein